jgi:integrase
MARPIREIPYLHLREGVYNVSWYEPPSAEAKARSPNAKGKTKRFGLRTRDPVEAQARFAAFLSTGQDLVNGFSGDAGITVSRALDDYYREHVTAHVADKVRQENAIRHLKNYFGDVLLRSIDIPQCRAYTDARRKGAIGGGARRTGDRRKGSEGTIKRELNVLKAAANHALRWKRIDLSQFPTFEMPREHQDSQEAPWLTKDEVALLLRKAEEAAQIAVMTDDERGALRKRQLRDFMLLTYWWGARRRSVQTLETCQVALETGRVNLHKAGQQVTKKRRPIVPVFPEIRSTLERLVAEADEGWLFGPNVDFYRPFRELCEDCGLGEKAWPHVLRHSRATHMLMAGESIYKVAKLLGDTVKTVERVYGHHSVEFLAESRS